LIPFAHQLVGARFLSDRKNALLADEPRVGKTGAAILAADDLFLPSILVVTTASGRPVWRYAFSQWSSFGRSVEVLKPGRPATADVVIVSWQSLNNAKILGALLARKWSVVIGDESHLAKNFSASRTRNFYGGNGMGYAGVVGKAERVWCLTGTPAPHAPDDLYPMMVSLCPQRLDANSHRGWPDVNGEMSFRDRYCIVKMKQISQFRKIPVVIGGRNEPELKSRLEGFVLRRTQKDIGIHPPIFDMLPLSISPADLKAINADLDKATILAAARTGNTKELEMHLGPLRRLTGEIKAKAVIEAAKEEFDCGLDKLVLAYWHRDVGAILRDGLAKLGVVGIDGSTPTHQRESALHNFSTKSDCRIFLAQIEAAGEAIDLSAAAELWFVEQTFSPRHRTQMSMRITNINQRRNTLVRTYVLEGSIDEAVEMVLSRLTASINAVLNS
jgi:SNF2 family DNA or RNA helicase